MPFLLMLLLVITLQSRRLLVIAADCPLDFNWSNFTLAASACSNQNERAKCCRYINAITAVSVARYTNATGTLGVPSESTDICLNFVAITLQANGIPSSAITFCGLGPKIQVSYQCQGRRTVSEMLQTPNFGDVIRNCQVSLSLESSCRRCVKSDIIYLHHLIGAQDNVTLSTCRDAAFVALANLGDNLTALDMANCFFGVEGLSIFPVNASEPPSQPPISASSPNSASALAPSQHLVVIPKKHHRMFQLTLILGVGILVTGVATVLFTIFILLICKKSRELKDAGTRTETSCGARSPQVLKPREGPLTMFQRFNHKEIKRATKNFSDIIGRGESGTVYKAQFHGDFIAAVKRINRDSEQGEEEFSRDMELLGRLHHRQLVAFRGYCAEKHARFVIYEYMENGSLKDHLHLPDKSPIGWQIRIQIAIDVANALEYLHFYCDPPLCHGDIKPSNILLDENFVAKVADFGLVHASRGRAINFEPANTDVWETPGYMDPEYGATQELTEKSDVFSFGMLLLELVSGRPAIFDDKKCLLAWSQNFIGVNSKLHELVDPAISDSFDPEQLKVLVGIIQWCTQRESRSRPSIKQVIRLLYERLDPLHCHFLQAIENEKGNGRVGKGKADGDELIPCSGDAKCLHSSSSTSRSCWSSSVLLGNNSP